MLQLTRPSRLEEQLRQRELLEIELARTKRDADTAAAIGEAEVILADPDLAAPHLARAASLKWLQSTYAGEDALLKAGARRGLVLTSS